MTEYAAVRNPDRCPTHPGAVLTEALGNAGLPKTEIASRLGISRQQLHDILGERKPVTAHTAVRLGKLLGTSPDVWVRMQAAHDVWHAAREIDTSVIHALEPI